MNEFLQRFTVGKRLFAGFGFLLVLMTVIAISAALSLSTLERHLDTIAVERTTKTRLSNTLYDAANELYIDLQALLLSENEAEREAVLTHIATNRENFARAYDELAAMPAREDGKRMVAAIASARQSAAPLNDEVIRLAMAGEQEQALVQLHEKAIPGLQAWRDAVTANLERESRVMLQAQAEATAAATRARTVLFVVLGMAMLAGGFLAVMFTRSLTGPLGRAAAAARDLANGKLDGARLVGGADEAGDVLRAIQQTREAVTGLKGGLEEMARQHDAGTVSFRTDVSQLQGEYRIVAESINTLVHDHITAALTAGELANRYASGDLSQDFPRMPGEKQVLMHAMDSVKASIQGISAEILRVSQAAVQGDFSVRGDEARFEFGFREMVANLNQLMATADGNLGSLSQLLRGIAEGDLSVRMHGDYQGVFARMRDDANTTVANLTGIVGRIQQATGNINTAASEIATGNSDLSRRTEQQAASLEETAASMEELTSTVRQNADHARQANQLAIGAADVASSGGQVVGEVVNTMGQIEESSRRIAEIISVIDGIAFQTNILALNAAVEAARAGEQGRGFAVVASEVRTLAQRSAAAAKEIKDLIDDSVGKVNQGSTLVRRAGSTMQEIVNSVQRVTGIMAEISAASQEQTAGIEQVNQTVMQMDEATQQNAALVEEASAAARAMEEQANQLADAVAVFRLEEHSQPVHTATRSAAATARPLPTAARPAPAVRHTATPAAARSTGKATAPARAATTTSASDDDQWQEF
ncbi:MCP four helix bundle domain-containing protein [Stenotrophomonas sp. W1S232]|uniref:MCP four helix bundle domain-containing protein n=1 Tax=Stenotrophomonas koreensis TaxID=266128 RepID=A0A7W3UZI5_9GAMM|nr:methyl-accepting chemotaxis protein [Stenotrophomonas koreensis]MBB1116684.1 MCP four helix bundle domain-containing protein [Stenotrophomonas koreensis]